MSLPKTRRDLGKRVPLFAEIPGIADFPQIWAQNRWPKFVLPSQRCFWRPKMADRLNDTGAIVRKGVHSYELKLRGDATIGMSGHWTSPLETPWNAERAGNGRGASIGVSPQYGGGAVMAARGPRQNGGSSPAPDKNRSVPGNGGSLSAAVACANKGC